jgi:hypothetical protein
MPNLAAGLGATVGAAGAGAVLAVVTVIAGTNVAMNMSSVDKPPPSTVSAETVGYADA